MKHLAGTSFDTLCSSLIHFVCASSSNCFINFFIFIFQLLYVVAWLIVDMSYSTQTSLKKRFNYTNLVFPLLICVLAKLLLELQCTENDGFCLFSLSKYNSLCSSGSGRRASRAWYYYISYAWSNVRYML